MKRYKRRRQQIPVSATVTKFINGVIMIGTFNIIDVIVKMTNRYQAH